MAKFSREPRLGPARLERVAGGGSSARRARKSANFHGAGFGVILTDSTAPDPEPSPCWVRGQVGWVRGQGRAGVALYESQSKPWVSPVPYVLFATFLYSICSIEIMF